MLRKLFKYEFKSFSRMMFPLLLVFLLFSAIIKVFTLNGISTYMNLSNHYSAWITFFIFLIPIYAISFVAILCLTFVNGVIRFNKSMFSNEGYLMRTIPVKTSTFLTTQLIVAFIWFIISSLCIMLSFVIFQSWLKSNSSQDLAEYIINAIKSYFGESISEILIYIISKFITFLYVQLLLIFSVTLASKSSNHKNAVAIAIAIVINIAVNFVNTLICGITLVILNMTTDYSEIVSNETTVLRVIFIVLFFILTCLFIDKKSDME